MSEEQLTGIEWTTKEGKMIDLANMDDTHLVNVANWLEMKYPHKHTILVDIQDEMEKRGFLPQYLLGRLDVISRNAYKAKLRGSNVLVYCR